MARWTDQKEINTDWLEKQIESAQQILRRNFITIIKIAPPTIGFITFLSYFYQNKFYPSFDLFQFSSLLLAAFVFGALIFIATTLLISAPGWFFFYWYLNTKHIKSEIIYELPYVEPERQKKVMEIFRLSILWPLLIVSTLLFTSTLMLPELFTEIALILPATVSLLIGIHLQISLKLRKYSFLLYLPAAYAALLCNTLLCTALVNGSKGLLHSITNDTLQTFAFLAIPLLTSFVTGISSICYFAGWRYSIYASAFIAIYFSIYSGTLTIFPEKLIRNLGLGNYTADVLLKDNYCEKSLLKNLEPSNKGCIIKDIKIIWSLGDSIIISINQSNYRHIKIPNNSVKIITQNLNK